MTREREEWRETPFFSSELQNTEGCSLLADLPEGRRRGGTMYVVRAGPSLTHSPSNLLLSFPYHSCLNHIPWTDVSKGGVAKAWLICC